MFKPSNKVYVTPEEHANQLVLHIGGQIDEDAVFIPLEISPKRLVLDLEKVRLINSCGLRNWVLWTRKLDPKTQIVFRNCPKPIVDQINTLDGFLPRGAVVESFSVPYHCDTCGHEENVIAIRGKDFQETFEGKPGFCKIPEHIPCSSCKKKMEIGIIPVKYFKFFQPKRSA